VRFAAEKVPRLLERHKQPLASVTTVLARLVKFEEVRTFVTKDKARLWQWVAERELNGGRFGGPDDTCAASVANGG